MPADGPNDTDTRWKRDLPFVRQLSAIPRPAFEDVAVQSAGSLGPGFMSGGIQFVLRRKRR